MAEDLNIQISQFFTTYGYSILGAVLFLLSAFLFAYFLGKILQFLLHDTLELDSRVMRWCVGATRTSIIVLAVISVLGEFNIHVTSLIAALGVFGFALALGLRTTITNFFTGIMLSALKPIDKGEYIEAERIRGVVESLNLFHTEIISDDGTLISIPNGTLWARSIKNLSRDKPRRLVLEVVVDRNEFSLMTIKEILSKVLMSDTNRYPDFPCLITINEMSENQVKLLASNWYNSEKFLQAKEVLADTVRESLSNAGITIIGLKYLPNSPSKTSVKSSLKEAVSEETF